MNVQSTDLRSATEGALSEPATATAFVLDLREEGRSGRAALGPMPELSEADRAAAIGTWRGRMINEHVSARVFAALLPQLMRGGVAPKWQAKVAQAIGDELRHGRQCAAVVTALGGDAVAEVAALEDVPQHLDATPLEAALRNVLSISCLSETVAVALIGAERLRAAVDTIEVTLGEILADEVQHARMGWEIVEDAASALDSELLERLNAWLVVAFRHLVSHELAHLPTGAPPSSSAEDVGVCDGLRGRSLFFATVEQVIVVRLEALGFAAAAAWTASGGRDEARQHRDRAADRDAGVCAPVGRRAR